MEKVRTIVQQLRSLTLRDPQMALLLPRRSPLPQNGAMARAVNHGPEEMSGR
ncbi:hypothetical protein DPMN_182679 [Dreissena polymorpha]|uniref:Uncharacterized protein n=1 Tax=Dreissena polymorpha TaxID=45954 RepID=A0A9D4I2V3_DREPO|nr:hypothetical protein DPMN_182679 [Dreissena polymorpha]